MNRLVVPDIEGWGMLGRCLLTLAVVSWQAALVNGENDWQAASHATPTGCRYHWFKTMLCFVPVPQHRSF